MLSHHVKYGAWPACIISALYFGFFHGTLQQLLYAPILGLILAIIVLKSGSLIPAVIVHAVANSISIIQLFATTLIDNYDEIVNGAAIIPSGHPIAVVFFIFTTALPWLLMLAAVILLIVELAKNFHSFRMPKGDSGLSPAEKLAAFFTTPAVWAAIVLSVLLIVAHELLAYYS